MPETNWNLLEELLEDQTEEQVFAIIEEIAASIGKKETVENIQVLCKEMLENIDW